MRLGVPVVSLARRVRFFFHDIIDVFLPRLREGGFRFRLFGLFGFFRVLFAVSKFDAHRFHAHHDAETQAEQDQKI